MKYWLIIFLINPNLPGEENYFGKIEIQYPSKVACEDALRSRGAVKHEFYVGKDRYAVTAGSGCYSNDHYTGVRPDPGKTYD